MLRLVLVCGGVGVSDHAEAGAGMWRCGSFRPC